MIAARDRSGRMLSVFHNRRWDWDYATLKHVLAQGWIGRPLLFESAVCRFAAPRTWRGSAAAAGTILHDWGAHLVDQALQLGLGPCRRLAAWMIPGPLAGRRQRRARADRPRVRRRPLPGRDQPDLPARPPAVVGRGHRGRLRQVRRRSPGRRPPRRRHRRARPSLPSTRASSAGAGEGGEVVESRVPTVRAHWDAFYRNIAEHLAGRAPLAVTAEQAREVVRVLEAAGASSREHTLIEGPWGTP